MREGGYIEQKNKVLSPPLNKSHTKPPTHPTKRRIAAIALRRPICASLLPVVRMYNLEHVEGRCHSANAVVLISDLEAGHQSANHGEHAFENGFADAL